MSEDSLAESLRQIRKAIKEMETGNIPDLSNERLLELINQVAQLEKQVQAYVQTSEKLLGLDQMEPGRRRELRDTPTTEQKGLENVKEALKSANFLKESLERLRKKNWERLSKEQYPPGFFQEEKEKTPTKAEGKERGKKFRRMKNRKDWKPL